MTKAFVENKELKDDNITIIFSVLFAKSFLLHINCLIALIVYCAPPSRPKGPRRCPDRGNASGLCISIFDVVMVTICNGSVYLLENSPSQIIPVAKLGSSNSNSSVYRLSIFSPVVLFPGHYMH